MRRIERTAWLVPVISCLAILPAAALTLRINPGQMSSTIVMEVTPDRAAPDGIVTLTGYGLGKSMVRDFYLVDSKGDHRVEILAQADTLVSFRVPASISLGRKRVAIERIAASDEPNGRSKLVEQDVNVEVVKSPALLNDPPMPYSGSPTGL